MKENSVHIFRTRCFVPHCSSSTFSTPYKVFVQFPTDEESIQKWLHFAGVPSESEVRSKYACEDHFDLKRDMANITNYKLGLDQTLRTKPGVVPRKFKNQDETMVDQQEIVNEIIQSLTPKSILNRPEGSGILLVVCSPEELNKNSSEDQNRGTKRALEENDETLSMSSEREYYSDDEDWQSPLECGDSDNSDMKIKEEMEYDTQDEEEIYENDTLTNRNIVKEEIILDEVDQYPKKIIHKHKRNAIDNELFRIKRQLAQTDRGIEYLERQHIYFKQQLSTSVQELRNKLFRL